MKQIIGYMEYDYMNIKRGIGMTAAVFGIVSVIFSFKNAMMTVGYMLFGGLVLASTMFAVQTVQTVSFDTLVPGSAFQKVAARYLGSSLIVAACGMTGFLIVKFMRLAGYTDVGIEIQLLAAVGAIGLFLLALQNLAFYALLPLTGTQFASLLRMVPGFVMFFGIVNDRTQAILSGFLQYQSNPGFVILGAGAASLFIGLFLSWLIVRGRDGE